MWILLKMRFWKVNFWIQCVFLPQCVLLRDLENPQASENLKNFSGVPSWLFTSIGDSYTKEFCCSSCCWTELYKSPFFFHLGSSVTLCNKKWHPGTLRSTASFSRAKVGKRTVASWEDDGIGHRLQLTTFFVILTQQGWWGMIESFFFHCIVTYTQVVSIRVSSVQELIDSKWKILLSCYLCI